MPVKIFFCYAHKDERLLSKLKIHLKPLQRQGLIDMWHDRDISAGAEWEQEIDEQLNSAQLILLLISPDFMNSDYCYSIEMKRALERHEKGEARVIPVILYYVYWQGEPLGKLQALPKDAKPVTSASWHNLNEAFFHVAEGIRKAAEVLLKESSLNDSFSSESIPEENAVGNSASTFTERISTTPHISSSIVSQKQTTTPPNIEIDAEVPQVKMYEELRILASEALRGRRPYHALDLLKELKMSQIPSSLCWRLAALRGQCYFTLRQFLAAERDFMFAATELPEEVPADQCLEAMTLHLHLAAALRELERLDDAFSQYQAALNMMDTNTPLHFVAEAHWGMSLIAFEAANRSENVHYREAQLSTALKHAENASILYQASGENLRNALLTCQIGLIEQASGNEVNARKHFSKVLQIWSLELKKYDNIQTQPSSSTIRPIQEIANVISTAACSLAGIELEAHHYQEALNYVQQAKQAGQHSYKLRRAEAEMMLGRILEAMNVQDRAAEEAFRKAISELSDTDRIAAKIRAHDFYGRHLLKRGQTVAGEAELDKARRLSHINSSFSTITFSTGPESDDPPPVVN